MSNFIEIEVLNNDDKIHGKILINLDYIEIIDTEIHDKFGKITILKGNDGVPLNKINNTVIRSITSIEDIRHKLGIGLH